MAAGIRCFPSPTRHAAQAHPRDDDGWMLQGEALDQQIKSSHPLLAAPPRPGVPLVGPACFQTLPEALTWQLHGGKASAALKRTQQSALLGRVGIDPAPLTSIDRIDAALCAPAAHHAAIGAPCRS